MMRKFAPQERKRKTAAVIIAFGITGGFLYPVLDKEFGDPFAFIRGITIGLLGSAFIAAFELYFSNPLNKKLGFINKLVSKSISYTLFFIFLIMVVFALTGSIEYDTSFLGYIQSDKFKQVLIEEDVHIIILYALVLSSAILFTLQLSSKMGQGVLWNFITGKYHNPKEEERIFMFMDLNHSTTIAEKLGDVGFSNFLNDIFFDLTRSILNTYGEIYRYVGDEVVITWKMKNGLDNANCIRTFFLSKNALKRQREKYMTKYGFFPTFSAGYHCGKVIVGEIGDIKSQITFLGDVLYTTANIEKKCRVLGKDNLVSEDLIKRISLPDIYKMKPTGTLEDESSKKIDLYTVSEIEIAAL